MGVLTLPGTPPIDIVLRRSARAKRLSLRISQLDGKVTLTLPQHISEAKGRAFALEKQNWIAAHLEKQPDATIVGFGSVVPIEGRQVTVRSAQTRRVILNDTELLVGGIENTVSRRVQAFLKELARDRLTQASDQYAAQLGVSYKKITLRDTRSRWGSCTSEGGLMYSWRLILAPADVLQYVAAHEVAHLRRMDHSPQFWEIVGQLFGDHKEQRRWLRTEGLKLHSYRF